MNWKRFAFKAIYYLTTILCFGMFVWALKYAYHRADLHTAWWVLICIAISAYYILSLLFSKGRKRGFSFVVAHSILLQLIPIVATILALTLTPEIEEIPYKPLSGSPRTYERSFNDMQDKQKAAALANGLAPFKSQTEIEERYRELRRKDKLVKIETNSKYVVRPLTYSSPYVVPKVERLLEDIGEIFQAKTQSKTKFMVTSVLRTEADIKKLSRVNGNASAASCHCNATTIDISYVRFENDEYRPRDAYELRLALAQTLHELRKAGRCYVKIERKQYCYHITVR